MIRITLALVLLVGAAEFAAAGLVTITFEETPSSGSIWDFYADEMGASFDANWQLLEGGTTTYPTHSGDNLVYSTDASGTVTFDDPVSYVSGWFTNGHSTNLYLRAYDGLQGSGTLLDEVSIGQNPGSMALMEIDAREIMSVEVRGVANNFTMDDFAFELQVIPEPSTAMLAGMLLAGLAWRVRRK